MVEDQRHPEVAEQSKSITRRLFLSRSLSTAGSIVFASSLSGAAGWSKTTTKLNPLALKDEFKFKGAVLTPSDADFEKVAIGVWNKLTPGRRPQMIVQVEDEDDVVAAVKFARANKLKVSVRGGGHNWCSPSLRNKGLLIDLSKLTKVVSIDPEARRAVVQPIISNREIQAHLKPHNLAYPSGHCPPVKLSGYLLSGGMSWNQGTWGHGCDSVEAVELVTADGELITASQDKNQDYYWAARGAGPGLFAVAVRYHLKLYPLPKAITASVYYYPYENLVEVADWIGPLAAKLPASVELSLFLVQAPKDLADKFKSSNGKAALVTGTVFADTPEEAKEALSPLDSCPVLDKCVSKSVNQPTDFESLFDASGSLWPGDLRSKVDAHFSNATAKDLFKAVKDHFLQASPKTVYMFAIFTGKDVPAPLKDGAFSMTAKYYGGPWTMWEKPEDDAFNMKWHDKCMNLVKPMIVGHYVAESDTVAHPDYARKSFTEANWKKLGDLRKKYDPQGVFFDFNESLT